MKALTLVKNGAPDSAFEMREHPKPEAKAGQVLIKVEASGLNFADVMARKGLYRECPPLPAIIGYDVAGVVEAVGEGGDASLVGKRVTAMTRFGGYAEYAVTQEAGVAEIPEGMSAATATALATQYCTAWHCACDKVNLFPGEHVLVQAAAGGVGQALVQLAKWKGCTVFGTASNPEKLEYLKEIGCDYPINYREKDYVQEIKKVLGKQRLDAAFNAVAGDTIKKDMKLLSSGGSLVCFGAADRTDKKWGFFSNLNLVMKMGFTHPIFLMMRSKTIVGVNMLKVADYKPVALKRAMENVIQLTNEGVLKPKVGGEFDAKDVGKAHALLEGRKSMGKIALLWG